MDNFTAIANPPVKRDDLANALLFWGRPISSRRCAAADDDDGDDNTAM